MPASYRLTESMDPLEGMVSTELDTWLGDSFTLTITTTRRSGEHE